MRNIENVVVDEANKRTYIILAPRLLSDGEIYRAIRSSGVGENPWLKAKR